MSSLDLKLFPLVFKWTIFISKKKKNYDGIDNEKITFSVDGYFSSEKVLKKLFPSATTKLFAAINISSRSRLTVIPLQLVK